MKELIHQDKGNFIFWKLDSSYSILFLHNKNRKKEREYALTDAERDLYFKEGMSFIRTLVEKKGK